MRKLALEMKWEDFLPRQESRVEFFKYIFESTVVKIDSLFLGFVGLLNL